MMRTALALLLLGITGTPISAACRWVSTELDCSLGGAPLLIGTPIGGEQPYSPGLIQGFSGRLSFGAGSDSTGFGVTLQHFDPNAIHCWQLGNERYCY